MVHLRVRTVFQNNINIITSCWGRGEDGKEKRNNWQYKHEYLGLGKRMSPKKQELQ